MLGSLALVLGMLWLALWLVRRFNLKLPGRSMGGSGSGRIELVERTAIDPRRSLVLLRRDGREHLILLAPEGSTIIEIGIRLDAVDEVAQQQRRAAEEERRAAQDAALQAARAALEERTMAGLRLAKRVAGQLKSRLPRPAGASFAALVERASSKPRPTRPGKRRPPSKRSRAKAA